MKKVFQLCTWGLAMLLSFQSIAQDPGPMTLEGAVDYAIINHTSMQKAEYDLAHSKAQVREYTAIGIPKVTGKIDYNYFIDIPVSLAPASFFGGPPDEFIELQFGTKNQLTFDLTVSTLAFDASYFIGLKASRGLMDLTRKQGNITKYELKYNVTNAYLTVLVADENRKILVKNIENLDKTLKETQAFYDNGLVEQLDVDRLQLSLSNLKAELEVVDRQVELAHNVLKFQMNYPFDKELELSNTLEDLMTEAAEEDLEGDAPFNNRPELSVLNQSKYLNGLNLKRYQMSYLPSLTAFLSHRQTLQRNDLFDGDAPGFLPTTLVGLSLNIPVFDGFDKAAKIQKTKIDILQNELQIKEFKNGVDLQVRNARTNYKNAQERLGLQKKNLELAERIMNTTKIKYNEGVGSSLEMVQAERDLYSTQANYMNALYDFVVAKTNLDQALGN